MSVLEKHLQTVGFGSIYGHVFENQMVGIARQLFWSVTEFEGLVVVPENLNPKADTPQKAREALKEFISLSELQEPKWQRRFRYLFQPT